MLRLLRVLVGWLALIGTAQAATTTTTLAVTTNGNPTASVSPGTMVTLTATVQTGSALVSPGQVKFCDADAAHCTDIHLLAMAQLTSAGTATFKLIPGTGTHHYKAVFVGTNANASSTSALSTLAVTSAGAAGVSTAMLAATGGSGNYTLTATVTGKGSTSPTGSVSFLDTSNAGYELGTSTLAAGNGVLSLVNSSNPAVGSVPYGIGTADFNGDGIPDLAVANANGNNVQFLLGNGDGTFTLKSSVAAGINPSYLAIGDFNADGIPDVAVTVYESSEVLILLGQGDGSFLPKSTPATGVNPWDVVTGDFNGDGKLDLAVTNSGGTSVTILLGNGDGTFNTGTSVTTGTEPIWIAPADFNGDGKLDLVVSNTVSGGIVVLLGYGDGTFSVLPGKSPLSFASQQLVVGDFNGDGKPDVAALNENTFASTILLGNGDGTFTLGENLATGFVTPTISISNSLAVGDFNGDGVVDLAVADVNDGVPANNTVTIWLGKGDGTFTQSVGAQTGIQADGIAVADFNGDGRMDLATANDFSNDLTVLLVTDGVNATGAATGISPVGTGTHYVVASYPGDSNYSGGTSSPIPLTAQPVATTLALTATPSSSTPGQSVTLSVSLAPDAAQNHNATGIVTFLSNGNTVGTGNIANGVASWSGATLPAGSDALTAVYAGDNDFATSTSNSVPLTVGAATSSGPLVEPVGSTSAVQTVTVTIGAAEQLAKITALTQGVAGLDFNAVTGGSCTVGTAYTAGQTCTVKYTFTPQRPGVRYGAAVLSDASGDPLATVYLQGTGTGPMLNFSPGTTLQLPFSQVIDPYAVTVDAAGSLYIVEATPVGGSPHIPSAVVKETKSGTGYVQTTVASNLVYPVGVAVDGAGNVFIADQDAETVVEASPINGGYSQTTVFSGLGNVESVAVDGSGNVYIGSLLVGLVKETLTNGTYTQSTINSRVHANALAVDGNGVLYVSQGDSSILAETPSNGGYTETTAVSGLSFPRGLSVDGLGSLYIADYSLGVIYKELPLQFGGFLQSTAVSGFDSLETVAVDGGGNLYFATNYFSSSNPGVFEKDNFDPPSLHFATTAPGQTSSDSPQTVTFVNVGNGTLQFGGTSPQALNPTISTGFDVDTSSTCFPNPGSATEVSGLGPLTSCIYQVSFEPPYGGPWVGTMVVADNNLNTLSPTQTIPLNGISTGTALPVVTSISPNSGSSAGNTPVAITGLDLAGASSVQFGSVPATSFVVNSATSISAVSPPGTSTVDVTVTTPDGTSATGANDLYTYTSTTQAIQFTAPTTSFVGTSVLLQATGGASGNPVIFSVVSGPAMVSGTNGSTLTYTAPGTVVVEADQAAGGGYTAAPPVQITLNPVVLTEPVGSSSAAISTLVTFQTAGTLSAIRTSTQGVAGLDFSQAAGGTCSLSAAYTAGQTCLLEFSFTPTHPGQRLGGAVFTTASGTVLATSYFYGVGTGPQVTFSPGTQTNLAGTITQSAGVAVDGAGDVFVASYGSGLYEIPVSGQPHPIGSFGDCEDVSVDGAGNVFVVCNNTTLSEVMAVNGTVPNSPTIVTITSQFNALTSVKVDGLGNVYVSSLAGTGYSGGIYKVISVDGSIPASPVIQTLSTALTGATGVAVDASGNLYVSDQDQNAVFEVMAVNGSIPASPTILTLATGLNLPSNITLDAAGNVFVSDYGDSDVKEILAVGGSVPASNPTILSLGSGLATPQGLFVDPSGNIFVADSGLTQAVELNYAIPPALSFAPTIVGQTSSDSPQSVTLTNDGNAALLFATPGTGFNPAISSGFTLGGASTCPLLDVTTASSPLAAGASCTDMVSFTPVSVGTLSGQLVTTDNALNQGSATQIVPLNGVALNLTAPTITFSVTNQTLGNPPFTVAAVSNSPGTITYSVVSGPATISGSTVTLTGAGVVELQASQAASGIYAAGTALATFNVAKEPQTITFVPLASPLAAGAPPVPLVATASSGLPVSFSVLSGPATVSGTLLTYTGTGTVVVAANQAGNAQYAAAPTVTQTVLILAPVGVNLVATPNLVFLNNPVTLTATLSFVGPTPSGTVSFFDGTVLIGTAPLSNQTAALVVSTLGLGAHSITASYGGNTLYAAASSPAVAVTVEDFALALTTPNLTIFHGGTATFILSVSETTPAGMASTVDLAVTGAPDGSQITLTPASITAGAIGTTPVTLVIQTPNYPSGPWATSSLRGGVSGEATLATSLLAGGLLLPFGSRIRRRVRHVGGGLLAVLVFAALLALGGCGSGWRTQAWNVNVTATSGQLSHTVTAVLTSKCEDGQVACPIINP